MKFLVLVLAVAVVDLALANSPPGRRAGPPAPPPGTSTPAPVADGGSFSGRQPGPPSGNPSDVRRPFGIPRPPAPPPGNGNGGNGNGRNGNGGNGNGGNGNGRDRQADRPDPRRPALRCPTQTNSPCSTNGERLPCHSDCTMYLVCVFDTLKEMPCGTGTHFNSALKTCDWPRNANCVPTSTTTATPISTDTCTEGERSPVLDDCSKYYLCHRGELMRRSCPPGTEFNAATKNCLHASSANCRRILDSPADPDEDCKDQDTIFVRPGPEGRLLAFQCKPNFGYFPLTVNCTRPTSCSFPVAAEPIGENPISTRIVKDLPSSLP